MMYVELSNIPQRACVRLLTATSSGAAQNGASGTTLVSTGYVLGGVELGTERDYIMNATQAGWMCKYGSTSYNDQTTEPTSAPLSGNVNVYMFFMIYA
jgi:hypothetical protein